MLQTFFLRCYSIYKNHTMVILFSLAGAIFLVLRLTSNHVKSFNLLKNSMTVLKVAET